VEINGWRAAVISILRSSIEVDKEVKTVNCVNYEFSAERFGLQVLVSGLPWVMFGLPWVTGISTVARLRTHSLDIFAAR
jgi:hypothetical protein